VSINSWLWISGAKTVNNNEGFNGQFIQKFTQEQHFQRTGKQLSGDDAQIASNNVAYNFFEDTTPKCCPDRNEAHSGLRVTILRDEKTRLGEFPDLRMSALSLNRKC
jgi:hypothetical protein